MDTLEKAISDAGDKDTEFWLKIGGGVAKAVTGGAKSGADVAIDVGVDAITYLATGHELPEIMKSYNRNISRLLNDYFGELEEVGRLVSKAQKELVETEILMFEPLPAYVDVSSPNFRYEHFFPDSDPDNKLGPTAEEERRKYLEEQQQAGLTSRTNPIHRVLAGGDE